MGLARDHSELCHPSGPVIPRAPSSLGPCHPLGPVIPAKAGIYPNIETGVVHGWVPAYAGMTEMTDMTGITEITEITAIAEMTGLRCGDLKQIILMFLNLSLTHQTINIKIIIHHAIAGFDLLD